ERPQLGSRLIHSTSVDIQIQLRQDDLAHEVRALGLDPVVGEFDIELRAAGDDQGQADQLVGVGIEVGEFGVEVGAMHSGSGSGCTNLKVNNVVLGRRRGAHGGRESADRPTWLAYSAVMLHPKK